MPDVQSDMCTVIEVYATDPKREALKYECGLRHNYVQFHTLLHLHTYHKYSKIGSQFYFRNSKKPKKNEQQWRQFEAKTNGFFNHKKTNEVHNEYMYFIRLSRSNVVRT
jgi:hypothetical protein